MTDIPAHIRKAIEEIALASSIKAENEAILRDYYREHGDFEYDGLFIDERRSKYEAYDLHLFREGIRKTAGKDAEQEFIGNLISGISKKETRGIVYSVPEEIREPVLTWMEMQDEDGGKSIEYGAWGFGIRKSAVDDERGELRPQSSDNES